MFWRTGEFSPFLYRGGFVRALAGDGAGGRRDGPSRLPARPADRQPADALDRRTLLRDLPLALPGDRPHLHRPGRRRRACSRTSSRLRRSSSSPSSPGATSRTRSATGRWRALAPVESRVAGGARGPAAGLGGDRRRGPRSSSIALAAWRASACPTPPTPPGVDRGPDGEASDGRATTERTHTLCRAVVHIGDSTSEGLVSTEYVRPEQLISAQYAGSGSGNRTWRFPAPARSMSVRRNTQRPGSRPGLEGRRLQRLLGAGDGDQRGGQRRRRLHLRLLTNGSKA